MWRGRVPDPQPERVVLLFAILAGAVAAVFAVGNVNSGAELDFQAYYVAGQAVSQGEPFVGWAITEDSFLTDKAYVYTPITAPVFAVYTVFSDWFTAYLVHMGLLLVTFYALGRLTIRYIQSQGRDLGRVDRWLILGASLFSAPAVIGLFRGNIDPVIMLMLVVGLLAVERGNEWAGGTLWAVAALFKLFPALLGVWLIYRRAYRAIAAALAVGIGATLLSLAVFGLDMHLEFIEFVLTDRNREGAFVGGLDATRQFITLRRPLSQFLALSSTPLALVGLALLAPSLAVMYRAAESELDRFATFTATVIALLLTLVPSTAGYVVYLVFPLFVLVYLAEHRATRGCLLTGLALINVPLYPQHIQQGLEEVPLAPGTAETITGVTWTVLTYGSIGLWGFLFAFIGCLLVVCLPGGETER